MDHGRERKVDIENMSAEEADRLSKMLGDKLRALVDETAIRANNMLKIYGMKCKLAFVIEGLPPELEGKLNDGTLPPEAIGGEQS
jgi:hypothetical protein